jgi:hypothetical protein
VIITKGTVSIGGEVHDTTDIYVGDRLASHGEMAKRIAELEAALRKIVYFDSHTVTWRCGYHGDQDVTDEVGHVLTVSK